MSPATRPAAPCCAWDSARTSTGSPLRAAPARSAPSSSSAASRGARCAPERSGAKKRPLFPGVGDHALGHQAVPDEEHHDGADHRGDESGALIRTVVSDGLTDPGRQERAGDPQQRGQDEARRIVRPGRQEARDKTGDEADDDDPKDTHGDPRNDEAVIFAWKRYGRYRVAPGRRNAAACWDGAVE